MAFTADLLRTTERNKENLHVVRAAVFFRRF
jgi:hypothetical protein